MEPTKLQNEDFQEQVRNVSPSHQVEGMRRDNESIDDFEHLEPESSPVKEFQGQDSQTKVDKHPILDSEVISEVVRHGESVVNQHAPDYSFISASKLEPTVDSKITEQIGDGSFVSSSATSSLLDSETPLFGNKDSVMSSEIPEKFAFSQQPEDMLLGFSSKPAPKPDVEQLFAEGENLASKFETDFNNKVSNQKALSKAFMDFEREEHVPQASNDHGDELNKFMADLDFLKSDKKASNEPDLDPYSQPSEPDITSTLSEDKDKHEDTFLDSDLLEPSKPEFKLKGKLPDEFGSSKSSLSVHDEDSRDDDFSSQEEKPEKKEEPEVKPTPEPEHKIPAFIPEPVKPLVSVPQPSSKPETVSSSEPTIKSVPEKPSAKPEVPLKSKSALDDNELDEIKPIQLFHYMGLDAWFQPDRLHPKVEDLVYWRDPKKSGIAFGSVLGVLLSLSYFSLISVVAYLSLAVLTGTICFRIYKNVLQAVQKTSDGHPFKDILELDLTLPQDKVREVTDIAVAHVNAAALELRRLFLVEDLVDSIKFGVLLWCLTYVGSWFNGMTLIIIAFVALFTLPKVYENNKTQIDQNLDVVRSKIADITSKVKAAIPIGKKPAEEEKKDQ